ncbi:MAG: Hpt domain-containing protein, partial [Cyanobacteria bacterium P01_F01_bin.3]
PILDIRVIEQINSDKAFIKEVHQSFLSDAPTRLQGIKKAFSDGDASSLEQAAHAFKSLSSCIGAMTLFHLCKQIEVAGKTGHIHSAALLIQGLEADYQKVQLAISEYQQQL